MAKIKPPIKKPKHPIKKTAPKSNPKQIRSLVDTSDRVAIVLPSSKWVFFQNSALSSVPVMDDGHTIAPGYEKYVNDNNNTWINQHLKQYYKTYFGAHVFKNHEQVERQSYGFIADVVLRRVKDENNYRYVVDVLMAINIESSPDKQLIKKIMETGEFKTSMGCNANSLMCSMCGNMSDDHNDECPHVMFNAHKEYYTNYGHKSIIAEIACPHDSNGEIPQYNKDDLDSYPITFVENSILDGEDPAYKGVFTSYMIDMTNMIVDNNIVIPMPKVALNRSEFGAIKYWQKKGDLKIKEIK